MRMDSMVTCTFCGANDSMTDNDPPEDWHSADEIDLCPKCLLGIKKGVAAVKDGKVRPWEEVEKELFAEEDKK